jgi:DNA modification methylase
VRSRIEVDCLAGVVQYPEMFRGRCSVPEAPSDARGFGFIECSKPNQCVGTVFSVGTKEPVQWFSFSYILHNANRDTYASMADTVRANCEEIRSQLSGARYSIFLADCFTWLDSRPANSVHAIVTDPPYGLKEYTEQEKRKLRRRKGGIWRIPPSYDGCVRSPLPRFTVLTDAELRDLRSFFVRFAKKAFRILVPGGHVFIATNPLLSHLVYLPLMESGFEKRGEIIRLVQTLRGGDRPKNAHNEFTEVSVMARSGWEPWGLFRKPCEGRVQDNLRKWGTGGLRRPSAEAPFSDVIQSSPTRPEERAISPHPSLKPQSFMRQIVRAALPLGRGTVLDPFMGGGSTIAAAIFVGYESIGLEHDPIFFRAAAAAIPELSCLKGNGKGNNQRASLLESAAQASLELRDQT